MPYDPLTCAAICIVLHVLVLISIALRFYVRFYLLNNVSTDDYLAVGAAVAYTGLSLSYTIGVFAYGVGRYTSEVEPEDYVNGLKTVFIGELLYFLTSLLVKLSFISTLFRIVTAPSHRATLYLLAATGLIITTFTLFWATFICDPVDYFWTQLDPNSHSGSCKPIAALMAVNIVHASWTLIADLTLGLVLPAAILWSSQMRTRVKVSVGVLLGLGSVAAIATITRIVYLPLISFSESLLTNNPVVFWSLVESAVGVIASAGSTWRPLLKGDSVFSGSSLSGGGGGGRGGGSSGLRYARGSRGRMQGDGGRVGIGLGFGAGARSLTEVEEDEGILLEVNGAAKGGFVMSQRGG
ncbi:hypothetical protein BJX64DRAFT_295479 [Aspergillus heterothallicus]